MTRSLQEESAIADCKTTTAYRAKYFAHELMLQSPSNGVNRLSRSLFDALDMLSYMFDVRDV